MILALDASSSTMGWAVLDETKVHAYGTHLLARDKKQDHIGVRLNRAHVFTLGLIATYEPSYMFIESPAARFMGSAIPQVRVSGAIILACEQRELVWAEVTPTQAKNALFGKGKASKQEMLQAATAHLGYPEARVYEKRRDYWVAELPDGTLLDEHCADAIGVGVAAREGQYHCG